MSVFKNMDWHVTPAYGRDYKSQKAAVADWFAGKDFILALTGQYVSNRDANDMAVEVWIRYDRQRKLVRAV